MLKEINRIYKIQSNQDNVLALRNSTYQDRIAKIKRIYDYILNEDMPAMVIGEGTCSSLIHCFSFLQTSFIVRITGVISVVMTSSFDLRRSL